MFETAALKQIRPNSSRRSATGWALTRRSSSASSTSASPTRVRRLSATCSPQRRASSSRPCSTRGWFQLSAGAGNLLGQPESLIGLHGGLGAGAPHRRAGLADQLLHLLQSRASTVGFLAGDRIDRLLDPLQIESAVKTTLRRRWIHAAAKANRTPAAIRPEQQQIEIAGLTQTAMASDGVAPISWTPIMGSQG